MPSISVNTFKVHKIGTRPEDRIKRNYLSFAVIFNIEKKTALISFNLYNNKNELMTSYKKRVYAKGEEILLLGHQLETQQQNLNPTTLTVWLVDDNNQRISDIATKVLYITSFAPFTPYTTAEPIAEIGTGFKRGQAYQAPAEPAVVCTDKSSFQTASAIALGSDTIPASSKASPVVPESICPANGSSQTWSGIELTISTLSRASGKFDGVKYFTLNCPNDVNVKANL